MNASLLLSFCAGIFGGILGAAIMLPGHGNKPHESITTQKLSLITQSGKKAATLRTLKEGGAVLHLYDREGETPYFSVYPSEDQQSAQMVLTSKSDNRIMLTSHKDYAAANIYSKTSPWSVGLRSSPDSSSIHIGKNAEHSRISISAEESHSGLRIRSSEKAPRIDLVTGVDKKPIGIMFLSNSEDRICAGSSYKESQDGACGLSYPAGEKNQPNLDSR